MPPESTTALLQHISAQLAELRADQRTASALVATTCQIVATHTERLDWLTRSYWLTVGSALGLIFAIVTTKVGLP